MKTRVFLAIGIRIVILFTIGMMATFLPEHLRVFFGDIIHDCELAGCISEYGTHCNNAFIDPIWEWGSRHYWYYWMMVTLFTLALANFVLSIINIINKNYDTKNW